MKDARAGDRAGPGPSISTAALPAYLRPENTPLAAPIVGATAINPSAEQEPGYIERIISVVRRKLVAVERSKQQADLTLFQHQVVYTQAMSAGSLDVVGAKPNIAGGVFQAQTLGEPGGLGAVEPDGKKPNLAERRDRMAEKSEQGHFVQEMAKRLAPQFDALKMQSETVAAGLSEVKTMLDEHGHELSDIGRRMDDQYRLTIAHTQALENEIGSLRREMKDSSAKTNALLQAIVTSLQAGSASAE